ncbi:Uncharacterized conserved protein, DUF302 family [Haladaptatus litoreus]|uniref:Uncharacterized conserved protein, DUF302 family n=1 Tax=Haladaptatus litoreus TaxID=553468 RepID=A0A1N7FCY5_9EURY|nr:DUF302 domain-containing protein [Haladaptatus litoreus]SIR98095.1 Uncharacterized conserved protein, DUF302 family [Haladaptatus litoreus]
MSYTMTRRVDGPFQDVVDTTVEALEAEEFGVLSDINLQAKLEEKLDLEGYPEYRILGACNPPLAEQGLDAERDLGALLPCNVIVYEDDDEVVVSAVDPDALLGVVENPALDGITEDVRERFDRVLDEVAAEY